MIQHLSTDILIRNAPEAVCRQEWLKFPIHGEWKSKYRQFQAVNNPFSTEHLLRGKDYHRQCSRNLLLPVTCGGAGLRLSMLILKRKHYIYLDHKEEEKDVGKTMFRAYRPWSMSNSYWRCVCNCVRHSQSRCGKVWRPTSCEGRAKYQ